MKRLRDWSLPARLLAILATVAILVAIQIIAKTRAEQANVSAQTKLQTEVQQAGTLDELVRAQSNLAFASVQYLQAQDPQWGTAAAADFAKFETLLAKQEQIADAQAVVSNGSGTFEQHMAPFIPMRTWAREVVAPALLAAKEVAAGRAPKSSLDLWTAELTNYQAATAVVEPAQAYIKVQFEGAQTTALVIAEEQSRSALNWVLMGGLLIILIFFGGTVAALAVGIRTRLKILTVGTGRIASGDLQTPVTLGSKDEFGELAASIDLGRQWLLEEDIRKRRSDITQQTRLDLSQSITPGRDLDSACAETLALLVQRTDSEQGVFYFADETDSGSTLVQVAAYAAGSPSFENGPNTISFGDGLVGEAAVGQSILLINTPPEYLRVTSGLGSAPPAQVLIIPFVLEGRTLAVAELAALHHYSDEQRDLLSDVAPLVATQIELVLAHQRTQALQAEAMAHQRTERLLAESQAQTEELQAQTEELQAQSEELQAQSEELQALAMELQEKQGYLEEANFGLETLSEERNQQRLALEAKNIDLERSRAELASRTEMLDRSSQYKSQFMSNMSHELRTPLNSILILSERLAANQDGNLVDRQVEFADTINACGRDLLTLINDVLDLSKVESGRIDLEFVPVDLNVVISAIERQFRAVTEERGLQLEFAVEADAPNEIIADRLRVEQILKNLISNACKFTEDGSVTVHARAARPGEFPATEDGQGADYVGFVVTDSGIGISEIDLPMVFEPFKQVGTSRVRRQGGTGLGLSISRELAHAMGGDLTVSSVLGEGSTFTLVLPLVGHQGGPMQQPIALQSTTPAPEPMPGQPVPPTGAAAQPAMPAAAQLETTTSKSSGAAAREVADDWETIEDSDRRILIIEDDPVFAGLLVEAARSRGFAALVEATGAGALEAARRIRPHAVSLDIGLPDMDGWVLLDRFRRDPNLRHIPVQVISGLDISQVPPLAAVVAIAAKPVSESVLAGLFDGLVEETQRDIHSLLIVEDDQGEAAQVARLSAGAGVQIRVAGTGEQALAILAGEQVDCAVVDLRLPDMSGFDLIKAVRALKTTHRIPVVVYTDLELTDEQRRFLERAADSIVVKGDQSRARLLDETSLFLHQVAADLPQEDRALLAKLYDRDPVLAGRTILVVDDDPRNIFSLGAVLERHGIEVLEAEDGREALSTLAAHPETDAVLMDIMMPEMDGHEAMRRIRAEHKWKNLPVIALTAMAMPEDRQRAIEAGASDYLTKPVDTDQLISLLRVWLSR